MQHLSIPIPKVLNRGNIKAIVEQTAVEDDATSSGRPQRISTLTSGQVVHKTAKNITDEIKLVINIKLTNRLSGNHQSSSN